MATLMLIFKLFYPLCQKKIALSTYKLEWMRKHVNLKLEWMKNYDTTK